MKVLGLIVEYNPFHNGHLYHLEQSKKASGADSVICVMSGNFIQRGEPAIVNKWSRTKMALLSGVDLVIELPVVYAMSSAEYFAYGAVSILNSLGIVDDICFGSECGSVEPLDEIASILTNEPEKYKKILKLHLDRGISYPLSRQLAISEYLPQSYKSSSAVNELMKSSNNILGIEYLKAIKKINSKIKPLTINRIGNTYNSNDIDGNISSATSIRSLISNKDNTASSIELQQTMPNDALSVLKEEFQAGRGPVSTLDFEDIILYGLRQMKNENIKNLPYVSEGLENRIKFASGISGTINDLIEQSCTKRYTKTRIKRILFSILTGMTSTEFDRFNNNHGPQYIRVLGFNKNGKNLLSNIKKNSSLPLITKTADYKNSSNPLLKRMLEIEAFSTDMYVLAYKNPATKIAGQDFTQNIVII